MEKITIIYGPARSGKSRLATDIARNKNTSWITGRKRKFFDDPFIFYDVDETTELIIIDDIPGKYFRDTMEFLMPDEIIVNKRSKAPFKIPRPKIIITLQDEQFQFAKGASIDARFDFIKLESIEDYFKEREKLFGRLGKSLIETAISHIKQATQP